VAVERCGGAAWGGEAWWAELGRAACWLNGRHRQCGGGVCDGRAPGGGGASRRRGAAPAAQRWVGRRGGGIRRGSMLAELGGAGSAVAPRCSAGQIYIVRRLQ
jgi:hypothetical protein